MVTLESLQNSSSELVKSLATRAATYKNELASGAISPSEYAELTRELTDLDALQAACATADEQQQVAEAIEFLRTYLPAVL